MGDIRENLTAVRRRVADAARAFDRDPQDITLIAVSKTKPVSAIVEAYEAGQRHFGESYTQEAVTKITEIAYQDIIWHFIGPIQSNKTKQIAESFAWVHSIERIKIARRLNEQRPSELGPMNVCLQVNISGESSKSGITLDEISALAEQVVELPNLKLRGLMAIPQRETDFTAQRQMFRKLALAMAELNERFGWSLDTLSMGMSQDLEAAVAEGASMVRVGTDIFGKRQYLAQSQ